MSYFAGVAGAAGAVLDGVALLSVAAAFVLLCFLCVFVVALVVGVDELLVAPVAGLAGAVVWAPKARAAAKAVPNIKVLKRFIFVFSYLGRLLSPHYIRRGASLRWSEAPVKVLSLASTHRWVFPPMLT
jgi:hypothetical protein